MNRIRMNHLVVFAADGTVHVQNYLVGLRGQHHVHTRDGYLRWKEGVAEEDIVVQDGVTSCTCGLVPGQIREYDGTTWINGRFGDVKCHTCGRDMGEEDVKAVLDWMNSTKSDMGIAVWAHLGINVDSEGIGPISCVGCLDKAVRELIKASPSARTP